MARDVGASHDAIIDLFERIERFLRRLETHIKVPPTHAMMDLIVKIMLRFSESLPLRRKDIINKQRSASMLNHPWIYCITADLFDPKKI